MLVKLKLIYGKKKTLLTGKKITTYKTTEYTHLNKNSYSDPMRRTAYAYRQKKQKYPNDISEKILQQRGTPLKNRPCLVSEKSSENKRKKTQLFSYPIKDKIQNINYFGTMECKMLKFSEL